LHRCLLMFFIEHPEDLETFKTGLLAECADDVVDPFLELDRFFATGSHDDGVNADLRNDSHFLLPTGGVHNMAILLVVIEYPKHMRCVSVSECCGDIGGHRPPLTRTFNESNLITIPVFGFYLHFSPSYENQLCHQTSIYSLNFSFVIV